MERATARACLLLVIGIPGSGKTTLSRSLADEVRTYTRFPLSPLTVHFDDFYPLDLRSIQDRQPTTDEQEHFIFKEARHRIFRCIEYFIMKNSFEAQLHSGYGGPSHALSSDTGTHPIHSSTPLDDTIIEETTDWRTLLDTIRIQLVHKEGIDANGRLSVGKGSRGFLLILDDNMSLRSMRHEYYQLAREYGLGFAQVCIQCSSEIAKARNKCRPIPIPDSTIEQMALSMEYPKPEQNHWERLSICINNDDHSSKLTQEQRERILRLIEEALSSPVPTLPEVNTVLRKSCQLANIDNYVHQADKLLRKCVSERLGEHTSVTGATSSKEDRAKLARDANEVRKKVLDELRSGKLCGHELDPSTMGHAQSDAFRELVKTCFNTLLTIQ